MEKDTGIVKRADEFLLMLRKGEEFTKELLKENEKLRFRIAQLEETVQRSSDDTRIKAYEDRIRGLEEELKSLMERYEQVEHENKDFASKYLDVEEQNNALANLYVASYQLHSTLDFNEVLRIVLEIVINLIGSEVFAILLIDEKTQEIVPVASEGIPLDAVPRLRVGEGIIGTVSKEGESYFAPDLRGGGDVAQGVPIACIPLKIKDHVIGIIAIFSLLIQKESFTNIDYELFHLLAGHAATAIFSARLYSQSERKLTTIQSFLELLKDKPIDRG
ncbi:MAG TPA: GAF domain-containing protein [Thermodesulfovibrionales bacterium]|jgi:nitrate/nitrite-specific signal transduction histidine kinase|nr:GAF domain-containing protein [Thermodesulfovibrionales bacterium]